MLSIVNVGGIFGKNTRTILAHINWDEVTENKTATECLNFYLKNELHSVNNGYIPLKDPGKQSRKKHALKEAFRKNRYK